MGFPALRIYTCHHTNLSTYKTQVTVRSIITLIYSNVLTVQVNFCQTRDLNGHPTQSYVFPAAEYHRLLQCCLAQECQ